MNPGEVIAGRFAVERLAGTGGMGHVYRALDRASGEAVALKVLATKATIESLERFEREADALAGLDHPAIVRYVAHGEAEGRRYLAMEWLEGEDLAERLRRERLGVRESTRLAARVAEALGAAHACGVIHRDLKPSNLFLPGGAIDDVKLIDFGIARLRWTAGATQAGMVVGTPGYMAPEQVQGRADVDTRADVFALGCILFECLTGGPAFEGFEAMALLVKILVEEAPPLRSQRPEAPAALERLLARMLAKDPAGRPESGPALAAELRAFGAEEAPSSLIGALDNATLTAGEQRILCVVLVGAGASVSTAQDAPTLSTEAVGSGSWPALQETVRARGGQLRVLADGAITVTLVGTGLATDQAVRAAGCAIALRKLLPDRAIALATGRGEVTGRSAGGEAIERAARMLRSRAASGAAPSIDIDDVTAGLLDPRFIVEPGALGLELRGESAREEGARTLLGKPTVFVGREREIGSLAALFEECAGEPAARAALLTGPGGIGKSRLRHEMIQRIARSGAQIWSARGDPMHEGAPFGLVGQLVRHAADLHESEPVAARRSKLAARVGRSVGAPDRDRVTEFLGEVAGTPFPADQRVQLGAARQDPILMGDQMRRAWVDFVDAECESAPLVLVLEDLQWGDRPSVEYVDAALRVLADRPLMVLALARPEVRETFPSLWAERPVLEMRLGELSRRASERLIQSVLGRLPPERVAQIWQRSAGNALFLEEIIRATAEGRSDDLPETVLAMAVSRLEALDAEDRRLLRAASVFGEVFWRGGLAKLLGMAGPALDERLAGLERRELCVRQADARFRDERAYGFRHALHREAAYGMLTQEDRALGHRLAGEWLEASGEPDAMALAGHFERGGEPARAARFYHRAAKQALEGNDLAGAIGGAERAIRCGASGEALGDLAITRATAHNWRGEHAEAERWALQAIEALPRGSARWYTAVESALWAKGMLGDLAGTEALVAAMQDAHTEGANDPQEVIAMAAGAGWLVFFGAYDAGRRIHASAVAWGADLHDPAARGAIHVSAALEAHCTGDLGALRSETERGIACFEEVGDLRSACLHRSNVASVFIELGAYAEAAAIARRVLADAERMGLAIVMANTQCNLGAALLRLGDADAARATLTSALADIAAQGTPRAEGIARAYLAAVLLHAGDLDQAEAEAEHAARLLTVARPLRPFALATLSEVLRKRSRIAEALDRAREAFEEFEALGRIEEGEALVRLAYAEALDATGNKDAAIAAIVAAREGLLDRAAKIGDATHRQCFLDNVPENARTFALARDWTTSDAAEKTNP